MSEPPQCCICLDEFTNPAPLPCGHCFCLGCIGEYWRIHRDYQCPLCKTLFPSRPQLRPDHTAWPEGETVPLKAGQVACDVCPARMRHAVKSCLVCLASYCDAHLELHYQSEELGRHLLVSVVKNLEDTVCGEHGRQLDRFCRSDQTCICVMCIRTEHRGHHVVPIYKEAAKRKEKLKQRSLKLQQDVQERLRKVDKISLAAAGCGDKAKEAWPQRKRLIQQLQDEIAELQRKHTELEQLSQTEDDLHFLQRFVYTATS